MEIFTLKRQQYVPRPLDRVFPFFERPENLALITPPRLRFRLLTPSPVVMQQGRVIDYTISLLGREVRWRSLISSYQPPHCFVDEQLLGPYSFWHHSHGFQRRGQGTLLTDEVRYALPAYLPAPFRVLTHDLLLRHVLDEIFAYRHATFARFFGPDAGTRPVTQPRER